MTGSASLDFRAASSAGLLIPLGERSRSQRPAFGRTLRIALAMKGGISLAVWIGGAVAELDVLRRLRILGSRDDPRAYLLKDPGRPTATPPEVVARARHYARLLIAAQYDAVEFDVLAGASAGGLNAVLYGVA